MQASLSKIIKGYQKFREKYAMGDNSLMERLAFQGQKPEIMVVACSDSRVDPALVMQCRPGDLFTVRNVANIVPPYEKDEHYHGTSAALEFGVCHLKVKHLIILGHSQCGGMNALFNKDESMKHNDFIGRWVSVMDANNQASCSDELAQQSLSTSYQNCLSFPWIKERVDQGSLMIHRWFFDLKEGELFAYSDESEDFKPLK